MLSIILTCSCMVISILMACSCMVWYPLSWHVAVWCYAFSWHAAVWCDIQSWHAAVQYVIHSLDMQLYGVIYSFDMQLYGILFILLTCSCMVCYPILTCSCMVCNLFWLRLRLIYLTWYIHTFVTIIQYNKAQFVIVLVKETPIKVRWDWCRGSHLLRAVNINNKTKEDFMYKLIFDHNGKTYNCQFTYRNRHFVIMIIFQSAIYSSLKQYILHSLWNMFIIKLSLVLVTNIVVFNYIRFSV